VQLTKELNQKVQAKAQRIRRNEEPVHPKENVQRRHELFYRYLGAKTI
jgi:hypothetical protein